MSGRSGASLPRLQKVEARAGIRRSAGDRPAVLLAHRHEERVILVEERRIGGQVRLDEGADRLVAAVAADQPMPGQHAPRILVDDEHRTPGGVEQDGVGRLRPDAGHPQQILPKGAEGRAPHLLEAPVEALEQPAGEGAQPAGLQAIRSRRPHGAAPTSASVAAASRAGLRRPRARSSRNGARRAAPRGELDQDGAGGDLVRRPRPATSAARRSGAQSAT